MDSADFRQILGMIDRAYEAALAPDLWPSFLEGVSESIEGVAPGLAVGGSVVKAVALDVAEGAVTDYTEHYGERIQRGALDAGKLGAFRLFDWELTAVEELHLDWARPQGLTDAVLGHAVVDELLVGFGLYREGRTRPFGPREIEIIDTVLPHFGRAMSLTSRLQELSARRDVADAALEQLGMGLVLLGEAGRVLAMNQKVRDWLGERDGLVYDDERLCARGSVGRRLNGLVQEAIDAGAGRGTGAGGSLLVSRPSGKRSFELRITPVPRRRFRLGSREALAAVFIAEPGSPAVPEEAVLQVLYELTPAEARLAVELAKGMSLDAIAESRGVSRHTPRNQLKVVFEKTGTRRQAELVTLLHSGVARLSANGGERIGGTRGLPDSSTSDGGSSGRDLRLGEP